MAGECLPAADSLREWCHHSDEPAHVESGGEQRQVGYLFGVTFALGVVQILTMILIWHWGIRTMVIAYVLLNIIWLFVWQYFSRRLIGYRVWMFLKDILPFALAALSVMTATYFATQSIHNLWLLLLCRILMAVVLYYLVMRIAGAAILKECMAFVKKKMGKK